jgi:hypothetical protein
MAQDFRDGYERYTIGEHQCCCGMPEVVEADVGQIQRLERALEVLYQVGAMNWCPRLRHEDQVQGILPLAAPLYPTQRHRCSVSSATGIANVVVTAAPAVPPAMMPILHCRSVKRSVRRPHGATTVGKRSVKMRREQVAVVQKNLPTWS